MTSDNLPQSPQSMVQKFVHLHVHSEYSLVDGLVRIKPMVKATADLGMPAVALTDQSNLFALVRFYKAATTTGVKPITGVEVLIQNEDDHNKPFHLILLVQNRNGYLNLTELISRSYREGQHLGRATMSIDWFTEETTQGLIALSAGRNGDVGRALLAENLPAAESHLSRWLALFGDRYYLQLVRTGRENEEACNHASINLAISHSVPVVATNDVRFLRPDDFRAHEVRVCIHDGRTLDDPRRPKLYSKEQYLRSAEEMVELFSDIPEAIENTVEIAKRCNLEMTLGKNVLPDFPVPESYTMEGFLRHKSRDGLEWRLKGIIDPAADDQQALRQSYVERLDIELDVINTMGFPGYFLIVADFIQWAKDNLIPVGPGRGSGAGSLVAYALKITDLDPIEHELLFERFLNPERVSMPDFDIDFCMDKRDLVIDYVAEKYGRDSVSQIITFGSMAAKAVVRDVGRVLGHPYGFVDRIAKLVPFEIGMTLEKALVESEDLLDLYNKDDEVTQLIDTARSLEGLARNAGKHAGGVVIAPGKLTDFAPLYCEADGSNLVTQFDKDDVELAGLVKFDFLGLRTLTIIDWALKTVNAQRLAQGLEAIDISRIPMADKRSFDLIKTGKTTAVFQLESVGMRQLIKKLQPDSFDDITALVALFRPGPLQSGMVDDFIARKHGEQKVVYPHPDLASILKPTYGVILYQEQVMQIAQVLANYTLGAADLLRRAMGKKKHEEMAKQREIFMQGAMDRGVEKDTASYIFDLMEKFAGYGFNKSHSAAYALVAYQTLWLKAHYPAAFMAAVLSSDMDNTDKVRDFIKETRSMKLRVELPDVNRSEFMFTTDSSQETGDVIYGLGAIKGVGESAIENLVTSRKQGGEFKDLFDFCRRVDLRKANRRVLEALIRSGAMDSIGTNRATLMIQLPLALKMAEQHLALQEAGQNDLFGMGTAESLASPVFGVIPDDVEEWGDEIRLQGEKETLGNYFSGHPMDFYEKELSNMVSSRIANLSISSSNRYRKGKPVTVAGLISEIHRRSSQQGTMASVLLDDKSESIEATFFSEAFEQYRNVLVPDTVVLVEGSLVIDDFRGGLSIRAEKALLFEDRRAELLGRMEVSIAIPAKGSTGAKDVVGKLTHLLEPYRGGNTLVHLCYAGGQAGGVLRLGKDWCINPRDELIRKLKKQFGSKAVKLVYGHHQSGNQKTAVAV